MPKEVEPAQRSLKYENIRLNDYQNMQECKKDITRYFEFYNRGRRHQGIYRLPDTQRSIF